MTLYVYAEDLTAALQEDEAGVLPEHLDLAGRLSARREVKVALG